jgi:hypothetical protein
VNQHIYRHLSQSAAALLLAVPAILVGVRQAGAASNVQALVARAAHDTDSVRTLIHHDQDTTTTRAVTVKVSAEGIEDEVHNREHDYESVDVTARNTRGKTQRLHYTADLIFMSGKTYYRTSLNGNKWQSRKGMTFSDPFTGGWQRGRTTVTVLKGVVFRELGVSGGETRVAAAYSTSNSTGSIVLWISGGSTPYVVREEQLYHTTKGTLVSAQVQITFGPFNSPIVITAPGSQGSA